MRLLATNGDQDWIVQELAALSALAGSERFLVRPIVEPTDEFFPDPWTKDVAGVRAIARRLLKHAGLSLGAEVELFSYDDERVSAGRHGITTAWYAGQRDGRCRFGVAIDRLEDPATVVMVLAHEVAHAFRDYHGLEVADHEREEHLTDLTAVYLGFGILVANGASRYRTETVDGGTASAWIDTKLGYLPAPMLAFALAVQARARGLDRSQVRKLAAHLDSDQRASFHAALKVVQSQPIRAALLRLPNDNVQRFLAEVDDILQPAYAQVRKAGRKAGKRLLDRMTPGRSRDRRRRRIAIVAGALAISLAILLILVVR